MARTIQERIFISENRIKELLNLINYHYSKALIEIQNGHHGSITHSYHVTCARTYKKRLYDERDIKFDLVAIHSNSNI